MSYDDDLRRYLESLVESPASPGGHAGEIETYAVENYLARRRPRAASSEVTPLGEVFLRLRGKDAVQWLLTVEVAQSRGHFDPWRVPAAALEAALSPRGIPVHDHPEDSHFEYDPKTLDRMASVGAFTVLVEGPYDDAEPLEYRANRAMRDTIKAALEPGPWRVAVEAMLADERAMVIPTLRPGVVQATVAQTRVFAHEVRNALVPVRVRLDSLLEPDEETPPREQIEGARRGVVRVLSFVEEMLATSELMSEVATDRDLAALVRDAISRTDDSERVSLVEPTEPVRVLVPRSRLAIAVSNVVRNALQADPRKPVRVTVWRSEHTARVQVDDGGPGVPTTDRARIFDDGFTTRPGGTGYGLAYVKATVEEGLGGRVWCETSDLGGARFVIELPLDPPR